MKQVKISILFKIVVFLINFLFLTLLIILPKSLESTISTQYIISFFSLIISFILFFYVLKNHLLAIKLFGIFLFLNFGGIAFFPFRDINEKGIYLIYFICFTFLLSLFIHLFFIHKRIKKGVENLDSKYITEKQQHKIFFYTLILSTGILIIFRFGYYDIEKDIEKFDDSFFKTKYENTEIKKEDNLFETLKENNFIYKYDKKPEINYKGDKYRYLKVGILDCLYKDNCVTLEDYQMIIDEQKRNPHQLISIKSYWKKEKLKELKNSGLVDEEFNKKIQKEKEDIKLFLKNNIDILYEFLDNKLFDEYVNILVNEWSNKKYYKSDYENYAFTSLIVFNRDLQYKILYYLNNNEEYKAIQILKSQIKTGYTMLEGDSSLIETLIAITCLRIGFENVNFILNNYELSKKSKLILGSILKKEISISFLDNGLKNDHDEALKYINLDMMGLGISLYDYSYTKKGLDEIFYYKLKNDGIVPENIKNKYKKINFLKSNIIGQIIWKNQIDISYESQYKKLSDLEEYRKNLVEKLK